MSYVLYDSNGYLSEGPSVGGLEDLKRWVTSSTVSDFLESGHATDLPLLIEELEMMKAFGGIEDSRQTLLKAAKKAEDVLILSDGLVTEDDLRTAATSSSDAIATRAAKAIKLALEDVLPATLIKVFTAGGHAGVALLEKQLRAAGDGGTRTLAGPFKMKFNASNKRAAKWAREHATELAEDLSETSRERIREAVAHQQETGEESFDEIFAAVGDEDRADLIAKNESMVAVHEGQREGWNQAVEQGLLTGDERRTWIVTEDEKLCPVCEDLDGETADLDGEYPGGYDGPPAHVNCRCTEGLS